MKLPTVPRILPASTTSPKRVYYSQPTAVKKDLMPLYQRVAKSLDVKPEYVRAISVVESNEKPLTESGVPVIRFETGYWKRFRVASREAVAFDKAKNSLNLDARWSQFEAMRRVNEAAAIMSHSFGMWQIMGANFRLCLCADPQTFLTEMRTVEGQCKMLERFVKSSPGLYSALKLGHAEQVALHFNGPQFKRTQWDVKFAAASKAGGQLVWV